jgi:hypothetical protein
VPASLGFLEVDQFTCIGLISIGLSEQPANGSLVREPAQATALKGTYGTGGGVPLAQDGDGVTSGSQGPPNESLKPWLQALERSGSLSTCHRIVPFEHPRGSR